MLPLQVEEARHGGAQAESVGIGVVDARQERLRQTLQGLLSEAPPDKGCQTFIAGARPARQDQVAGGAQLATETQDRSGDERQDAPRGEELVAFRDRQQAPARVYERAAVCCARADDLLRQTGPAAQVDPPRSVGDETVGAALDDAAVDELGADHPARTLGRLEHRQVEREPAFLRQGEETVGAGEAGDTGARDRHAPVSADRLGRRRHARAPTSWTSAAIMSVKAGWSPAVRARKKPRPSSSAVRRATMSRS